MTCFQCWPFDMSFCRCLESKTSIPIMNVPPDFVERFKRAKEEFKRFLKLMCISCNVNEQVLNVASVWFDSNFDPLLNELAELIETLPTPKPTIDQSIQVSPDDINDYAVPKSKLNLSTNANESRNLIPPFGEANNSGGKILFNSAPESVSQNTPQAQNSMPRAQVVPVVKSRKRPHSTSATTTTPKNKQQKAANNEVQNQPSSSKMIKTQNENSVIVQIENSVATVSGDSNVIPVVSVEAQIDQKNLPSLTCKHEDSLIEEIDPNDDNFECECTQCVKTKAEMLGGTGVIQLDAAIDQPTTGTSLNVDDDAPQAKVAQHEHANSSVKPIASSGQANSGVSIENITSFSEFLPEFKTISVNCYIGKCKKTFVNQNKFYQHLKNVHKSLPFRCYACTKSFSKSMEMVKHIEEDHAEVKELKCTACNKVSTSPLMIFLHERTCCQKGLFACTRCEFVGNTNVAVMEHYLAIHRAKPETKYLMVHKKCTRGCEDTFTNADRFDEHMANKHGVLKFPCTATGCDRSFQHFSELFRHWMDHSDVPEFKCSKCAAVFTNFDDQWFHMINSHFIGLFKCTKSGCTYTGATRQAVIDHFDSNVHHFE